MRRSVLFLIDKYLDCSDTFLFDEMASLGCYEKSVLALHYCRQPAFSGLRVIHDPRFASLYPARTNEPPPQPTYRSFLKYARRVMHAERPAILHAQFGNEALFFLPLRRWAPIPLVVSFRGSDVSQWMPLFPRRFAMLFRLTDLFLPRSNSMQVKLVDAGCEPSKVVVHHSSIDLARFPFRRRKAPRDRRFKILTVARLVEKKGLAYSLQVFARFLSRFPASQYTIVGEGELRRDLEDLAWRLGITTRVRFLGAGTREAVQLEMAQAHIFLLTSVTTIHGKQEGIPVAIMEAFSSGLPVVSTRHAGIPELVAHGRSGLLSPEKNVDSLTENLVFLAEHPELWADFASYGRGLVEREFNIKVQTGRLERLYDRLLDNTFHNSDTGHPLTWPGSLARR
jgi:colanic acid/amylovoran biosynthesis glycosyltransferase